MRINLVILLLLLPCLAWGAPEVSGVSVGASTISVSGSGFGIGPTVYKWDKFNQTGEDYDLGDIIANGWAHTESTHFDKPVYSNTNARYSGSKHARMHWWYDTEHSQIYDDSMVYYDGSADLSSVYVSFYYRRENLNPGHYTDNNKTWRLCSNGADGTGDNPVWAGSRVGYSENSLLYEIVKGCNNSTLNNDDDQFNNVSIANGYWQRYEMYVEQSDPGSANGTALSWLQGTNGIFVQEMNHNGDYMLREEGCTTTWKDFIIGGYMRLGHLDGGTPVQDLTIEYESYYDDFYMASSRARVEIGNNAVWASCTVREIQGTITSWGVSSISVDVNQGALPDGTAYLFVVDSDGAVSSGYPITLGDGSSSPSTPSIRNGGFRSGGIR